MKFKLKLPALSTLEILLVVFCQSSVQNIVLQLKLITIECEISMGLQVLISIDCDGCRTHFLADLVILIIIIIIGATY